MSRLLGILAVACIWSLIGCGGDECADLAGALAEAAPGEVVSVSACTVTGNIDVPGGVTLDGGGESRILGNVTLGPGSGLAGVRIEGVGPAAVSAVGAGAAVTITDVDVIIARGSAVHIADRGAVLTRVSLAGNVEDPDTVPADPSADDYGTHGLVLSNAGTLDAPVILDDVSMTKFARFGALFLQSHVAWRGGQVADGLSTGLMADGGSVDFEAVELGPMQQGVQVLPAFGGIFTNDCVVTSQDLMVDGNQGYGLLHDRVTTTHENLIATGNTDAALWVQQSASFSLVGAATEVSDNVLSGLVIVESTDVLVRGATFRNNTLGTRVSGTIGRIDVGDGIHAVIDDGASLTVDQVVMAGNARVGVLLDVASGNLDGVLMDVSVEGTGDQLGAIAQGPGGLIDTGVWDTTVTRLGSTALNDEAISEKLSVLGIVGPMFLPPSAM
ncbi:MAG: hypothetical protein JRH11_00605 [Deltaproteobacteria bacterium]|nr:hypothetical protein [Deltaproteobacteria bacterium]